MQVVSESDEIVVSPKAELGSTVLIHVVTVPQTLIFLRGQVGFLQERGFRVSAVASPGEDASRFARGEGIPVYQIEMSRRITPAKDLVALWKLFRLFSKLRPDIVHAHTPKGGMLGTLAAFLARVPIRIYHIRGLPFDSSSGSRRAVLRLSERISCRLAHKVLAVSQSMRTIAITEGFCAPEKIVVPAEGSGNGVDASNRFDPGKFGDAARAATRKKLGLLPGAIVIGFVGRLVRDKGIVELTQAWRSIRKDNPALHLLIVGPVEAQDPVPSGILGALEADDRVHFSGRVQDVAPLYAAMDVLVLPTYREGFPNVPLEAAAMGLPVVATRVPGCVDAVVDGETGMLVAPRDPRELEEALKRYVAEPSLRRLHGKNARERVLERFRPEEIWRSVHSEYVNLLGGS
jgi:glycosyltransferase involved in cell wall biosynthesis